uniref:MATH domain-containing protein n=1 Tax=Meloidogyne floridensis TaxID=298350 RepID=A0A915PCT6_9BILA
MFSSVTKSGVITCKIEWKILDFWDLTELMSNDQCLTSKHLCDPKFPSTVIELRIYPNCCVYSEDGNLNFSTIYILSRSFDMQGRSESQKRDINIQPHHLSADGSLMLYCEVKFLPYSDNKKPDNNEFKNNANFSKRSHYAELYNLSLLKNACIKYISVKRDSFLVSNEWNEFKENKSSLAVNLLESALKQNSATVESR